MNALCIALLLAASAPDETVYSLKPQPFIGQAKHDLQTLKIFVEGLKKVRATVNANKDLFAKETKAAFSPDQKRTLLSTWGALFSYFSSAEQIRQRYWDFVLLPPTDERHPWGFLVTHAALTAILGEGLWFTELTQGNKQLETLLDEANPEFGVPANAYADFKYKTVHVATSTQLVTGYAWSATAESALKKAKALDAPEVKWAIGEIKDEGKDAMKRLGKSGNKLFAGNALDIFKDTSSHTIFPVQKSFAEWFGDTRVARVGRPLISHEQLEKLLPRMEPGDVMVARQNWFLSNIALPGFWPHAELYVGTPADLARHLDSDPEVQAWVKGEKEKAGSLTELLQKRYPEKWKQYSEGGDLQGHKPIRIIEAISEGVSFTAIEHAMQVDYLGVMRPRLPKLEKAKAIARAFGYQGRPYDFEFDFFSDSTLVCSELVFKSYAPSSDMKGIKIDLVDVAGRRTLPANEFVKLYDAEAGKPDRQFDFVAFLEGHEKGKNAGEATEAEFRKSAARVKWDIAQK